MTYSAKDDNVLRALLDDYANSADMLGDACASGTGVSFFRIMLDAAAEALFAHIEKQVNRT